MESARPLWQVRSMTARPVAAIVLAAGKGTRMKSDTHKVLHPVAGRPMLLHLLGSLEDLNPAAKVIVVGDKAEQVEAAVAPLGAVTVRQEPQLGTAHATLMAREALAGFAGDVLVMFGDVPLIEAATMRAMLSALHRSDDVGCAVLGFRPADPAAYGRILAHGDGTIEKMVEFKDALPQERAVTLCNSGLMAVRAEDLFGWLDRVGNDNAQGEYYLPDVVMIAAADGRRSLVVETDPAEVAGINSRAELAAVELDWQRRRRAQAMADGVSLVAPDTVWFSHDTVLGRDVTVGPNVVFGPGVTVADGATIHAFCHLEGCTVGLRAEVGPYARLRPGADLGEKSKVGNFVEVKKAKLGKGAKANHLAYLGDAEIGANANVGAGTITCNYDGFFKYKTVIGEGAFIGSNSSLIAPVTVGAGAIVGAGSAVSRDVPADALRIVRAGQADKPGWAAKFRAAMSARKKSG